MAEQPPRKGDDIDIEGNVSGSAVNIGSGSINAGDIAGGDMFSEVPPDEKAYEQNIPDLLQQNAPPLTKRARTPQEFQPPPMMEQTVQEASNQPPTSSGAAAIDFTAAADPSLQHPSPLYGRDGFKAEGDSAKPLDLLGFAPHAEALARTIFAEATRPPLTVGIYGEWGTGKSTFMKLVQQQLDDLTKNVPPLSGLQQSLAGLPGPLGRRWRDQAAEMPARLIPVWFNAWEYSDSARLWTGLLTTIAERVDREIGFLGRLGYGLRNLFRRGTRALFVLAGWLGVFLLAAFVTPYLTQLLGNLVGAGVTVGSASVLLYAVQSQPVHDVFQSLIKGYNADAAEGVIHDIQKEIKDLLASRRLLPADQARQPLTRSAVNRQVQRRQVKLVVFIDELDRCPLERIVDILEAIKLFLDEGIFIVLLAVDTRVAAEAIRLRYKDVTNPELPREYLEKIVQVPVRVPTAGHDALSKFVDELLITAEERGGVPAGQGSKALQQQPRPAPEPAGETILDYLPDSDAETRHLIELAESYLESNPRRIKRLLNTYRYVRYLDYVRRGRSGPPNEDWQREMLSWLAFTMRWPAAFKKAIERAGEPFAPDKLVDLLAENEADARLLEYAVPRYLKIDAAQVRAFAALASNFLIENPPPPAA